MRTKTLALLIAVGAVSAAQANIALFRFETISVGSHTSISETDMGITATTFHQGGGSFNIQDLTGGGPASWQARTLLPNTGGRDNMVTNFSVGALFVRLEAGDFFADDDVLTLTAWSGLNGTGTMLNQHVINYPASQGIPGNVAVLNVSTTPWQAPIMSVTYSGIGLGGNNNVYFDNMQVCPVPEPATMAALGLGALALMRRRRK